MERNGLLRIRLRALRERAKRPLAVTLGVVGLALLILAIIEGNGWSIRTASSVLAGSAIEWFRPAGLSSRPAERIDDPVDSQGETALKADVIRKRGERSRS
jgi:hypothetical protein